MVSKENAIKVIGFVLKGNGTKALKSFGNSGKCRIGLIGVEGLILGFDAIWAVNKTPDAGYGKTSF